MARKCPPSARRPVFDGRWIHQWTHPVYTFGHVFFELHVFLSLDRNSECVVCDDLNRVPLSDSHATYFFGHSIIFSVTLLLLFHKNFVENITQYQLRKTDIHFIQYLKPQKYSNKAVKQQQLQQKQLI